LYQANRNRLMKTYTLTKKQLERYLKYAHTLGRSSEEYFQREDCDYGQEPDWCSSEVVMERVVCWIEDSDQSLKDFRSSFEEATMKGLDKYLLQNLGDEQEFAPFKMPKMQSKQKDED
jgi:hypothetical protein